MISSSLPAVYPQGYLDATQSSTSTITNGSSHNPSAVTNDWEQVEVNVKYDQAVTVSISFGYSGTSTFSSTYTLAANQSLFRTFVKGAGRFFDIQVSNSSGSDADGVTVVSYGNNLVPASSAMNSSYGLDANALLTRPSLSWLDISRGLSSGVAVVEKFGYSDNIGTGWTPVAMAEVYQTPSSAVSLEFLSSDAADALDDSGAHEITVIGLDANWEEQTVSTAAHATDGTTAVAISGTWLRVYRAYVSKSGSYGNASTASHAGTITIRVASGGATYAEIPVVSSFGMSQSLIGAYTIPSGYTGYVFIKDVSADSGKTVDVAFFARESADDTSSSYDGTIRVRSLISGLSGGSPFAPNPGQVPLGPFVGPTDVGFLAKGATTPSVGVEFEVFLVNE